MFMNKTGILGIFLLIMGIAMWSFAHTYKISKNVNRAWVYFGSIYAIGIILINLADIINPSGKVDKIAIPLLSIIIMMIGISLSYIILERRGKELVIGGILLTIGIHFLPFNSIISMLLSILITGNCILYFSNKNISVNRLLMNDVWIKCIIGLILLASSIIM